MKRIIYPNEDGGVAVVIPAPNTKYTIEEIALKDVPKGKPYRIIEHTDVPTDRTFRNAWEYDFGTLDNVDGFGLGSEEFFNQGLGG
jgi:hypothetical protein